MKTLPSCYHYLEDLTLSLLEHELENSQKELQEATKQVANAKSYGGFPAKLKIATRRKNAALEAIKYIKQILADRQYD